MPSPISDTLSTLSDRGLRRLLGARTFLRGLEYARRRVVEDIQILETSAQGQVRGSDPDPYAVKVMLSPEGIKSECNCPVFAKSQQHCKHVAALLITVRDQARGQNPRPPPQHGGGGGGNGGGQQNQNTSQGQSGQGQGLAAFQVRAKVTLDAIEVQRCAAMAMRLVSLAARASSPSPGRQVPRSLSGRCTSNLPPNCRWCQLLAAAIFACNSRTWRATSAGSSIGMKCVISGR